LVFQLGQNSSLPRLPAALSICISTGGDACEYCPLVDPAPAGGRAVNPLKPNRHIKDKKSNTVFWNVSPNGYLHSSDCCYFF
jgi:hypothetical protein